jgi:hypothetical protein
LIALREELNLDDTTKEIKDVRKDRKRDAMV